MVKPESDNEINHELTLEVSAELETLKGWCGSRFCGGVDAPYLLIERFRTPPQVDFAKMLAEEADGDIDKVIKIISFGSDHSNKEQLENDTIPVHSTEPIRNELKPEWPVAKTKL